MIVKRSNQQVGLLEVEAATLEFLGRFGSVRKLAPALYGIDGKRESPVCKTRGSANTCVALCCSWQMPRRRRWPLPNASGPWPAFTGRPWVGETSTARSGSGTGASHQVHRIIERLDGFVEGLAHGGHRSCADLLRELERARQEIRTPGPFLTFTRGDTSLGNAQGTCVEFCGRLRQSLYAVQEGKLEMGVGGTVEYVPLAHWVQTHQ